MYSHYIYKYIFTLYTCISLLTHDVCTLESIHKIKVFRKLNQVALSDSLKYLTNHDGFTVPLPAITKHNKCLRLSSS